MFCFGPENNAPIESSAFSSNAPIPWNRAAVGARWRRWCLRDGVAMRGSSRRRRVRHDGDVVTPAEWRDVCRRGRAARGTARSDADGMTATPRRASPSCGGRVCVVASSRRLLRRGGNESSPPVAECGRRSAARAQHDALPPLRCALSHAVFTVPRCPGHLPTGAAATAA